MTTQEAIQDILMEFGGGLIEMEIEPILTQTIEKALRLAKSYMKETRTKTYKWAPVIDVSEDRIRQVKRIFSGNTGNSIMGSSNINDPNRNDIFTVSSFVGVGDIGGMGQFAQNFSRISQKQKMLNTLGSDIDYKYIYAEKKLYPISNRPPSTFTIFYVLDYYSIEDVEDMEWQNLIVRLATAIAKRTLGSIRTNYKEENALYSDNGENYAEDGKEEYNAVMEEMKARGKHISIKG